MDSREQRRLYADMIRRLTALVKRSGVTPSALAKIAGLHHDAVKRKLSGRDKSLMKEATFATLEKAADELSGESRSSRQALEAELDHIEREIAESVDELVEALVNAGVLSEEQLPPRLRRLLERRRLLTAILSS